jgi:hypothetical protein
MIQNTATSENKHLPELSQTIRHGHALLISFAPCLGKEKLSIFLPYTQENKTCQLSRMTRKTRLSVQPGLKLIDNSHYRLILKLGKEMQMNHHS